MDEFFRFGLWLIAAADGNGGRLWFEFSGFGWVDSWTADGGE